MNSEPENSAQTPIPTDTELWLELKTGNIKVLGQIYDRHAGLVYGVAIKVLQDAQEAEDLTQDIFLKLTKTSAYDPSRGSLRTFLAILTRSRAIDKLRSRKVARASLERLQTNYDPQQSELPNDTMAQNEQFQEVRGAIAELSTHQREILEMTFYKGLSQMAIAKELNMPLGTVKSRARRGLLKLKQLLEK